MVAVTFEGPIGQIRGNPMGAQGSGTANANPQEGPAFFNQGVSLLDMRSMYTWVEGQSTTKPFYVWLGMPVMSLNAVPATANAANIAASQSPGAGAIVLTAGAGVTGGVSITRADTGTLVTGLFAIDYTPTVVAFGQDQSETLWNPNNNLARRLQYVSGGTDTGITFTTTGFDIYNMPLSETITGAAAGAAQGLKAFKYVQSITHTGSVATTITVGTTDNIGFPLRTDIFGDVQINYAATVITASAGYAAAVTTSPSTALTADVRGIYTLQTASNGANRLVIIQYPYNINSAQPNVTSVVGTYGVTQNLVTGFSGA